MARTQIKAQNILDHSLTGASFRSEMGYYDETRSYTAGDQVIWLGSVYEALNDLTGLPEGYLDQSPDKSVDWKKITNVMWSAYPSTEQTFNNIAVTLALDTERISDPAVALTSNNIIFNSGGRYIINIEYTANNTTSTRTTSKAYLEKSTDGSNWAVVPNSEIWSYNRLDPYGISTGSVSLPIIVNTGDYYRVRIQGASSTNVKTVTTACNVSIFALAGSRGEKGEPGPIGPTGAPGDIIWTGPWDSNKTYLQNEAVEYLGTSYISVSNNNTETPSDVAVNWDIIAARGSDGSGTSIIISKDGANLNNTPHSILNFTGNLIGAVDAGSGTANIYALPTKHKYMIPIWAEENAALGADTYEWAFGNGANTSANNGMPVFIPSGYSCSVVGLSLNLNAGSAEVELVVNGTRTGNTVTADAGAGNKSNSISITPYTLNNADRINFRTLTASGTSASNVACAWLEYNEL